MKIADRVWLTVARLQREHGASADFGVGDVIEAALRDSMGTASRQSIAAHVSSHCVATCRPSPDRYRMLTRTARGRVRLFKPGDPFHKDRRDGPTHPRESELPAEGKLLLRWYLSEFDQDTGSDYQTVLQELRELGRRSGIWKNVDPDEYVEELRAGWDT